ncbi:trypsin-like serine protease [Kutzneria chonburiensis]|uniref:Trypsin-like serine protease n=1 Tax=Kutzneria chonburiensis TaxID=1483604 RepID=A0ABV6MS63_9PSEU|nr:trypsin-like serine protease [Kutzneria chonburiensis]
MKRVDATVTPAAKCRSEGLNFDSVHELCMISTDKATACYGDSGGPALNMATGRLVGVTSRGGLKCGDQDTLYTRVQPYRAWIKQFTGV